METKNRNQIRSKRREGTATNKFFPSFNLAEKYRDAQEAFDAGGFFQNFFADFLQFISLLIRNPGQAIIAAASVISSLTAVVDRFFGSNTQSSSSFSQNSSSLLNSFPGRLFTFIIIVASISWASSMICILLTARKNEIRYMTARAIAVLAAMFTALSIEWHFQSELEKYPSSILVYAILGMAISVFLGKTSFRYTRDPDPDIMAERAGLLFIFSAVLIVTVVASRWEFFIE